MATSSANRGKYAEGEVKKILEKHTVLSDFDYERIHDAFSSRGGFQVSRPGDFQVYHNGTTLIEVKEVNFPHRLPKANFGADQRARMKKRQLAGVRVVTLVYFKPLNAWRMVEGMEWFEGPEGGSWFFESVPTQPLAVHMNALFGKMAVVAPKLIPNGGH